MAQQVNVGVISTVKCVTAAQKPVKQGGKYVQVNLGPAFNMSVTQPTPRKQTWTPAAPLPNTTKFIIGILQTYAIGSPAPTD